MTSEVLSVKRCGTLLVALGLLMGCSSVPTPQRVTEEQARTFFDQAVNVALSDNVDALCDFASTPSNCTRDLMSMQERIPKQAPEILCAYELLPQRTEHAMLSGGQVLVVSGLDGMENPFRTEVLIFHDGHQLRGTNIVWWSNRGIGSAKLSEGDSGRAGSSATTPPGTDTGNPCK